MLNFFNYCYDMERNLKENSILETKNNVLWKNPWEEEIMGYIKNIGMHFGIFASQLQCICTKEMELKVKFLKEEYLLLSCVYNSIIKIMAIKFFFPNIFSKIIQVVLKLDPFF